MLTSTLGFKCKTFPPRKFRVILGVLQQTAMSQSVPGAVFGGSHPFTEPLYTARVEAGHLTWPKQDTVERTPSPHAHYGVVREMRMSSALPSHKASPEPPFLTC